MSKWVAALAAIYWLIVDYGSASDTGLIISSIFMAALLVMDCKDR